MTPADDAPAGREAEIRRALGRVDDPELDEPVTELRFIERIDIDDHNRVRIGFRLPTYWCAANFAFLMADDMRREVGALPWVAAVEVVLGEHMYGDRINHGLAQGWSFRETFGAEASDDLDALRRTFLVKSFQRRQEALLRHLLGAGWTAARLVELSVEALAALALDADASRLRQRYGERRAVCAAAGQSLAFVDQHGSPLLAAEIPMYLQQLSRVGVSVEFNGALCRGLLAARFDEPVAGGEPTLRDFARMPPRAA